MTPKRFTRRSSLFYANDKAFKPFKMGNHLKRNGLVGLALNGLIEFGRRLDVHAVYRRQDLSNANAGSPGRRIGFNGNHGNNARRHPPLDANRGSQHFRRQSCTTLFLPRLPTKGNDCCSAICPARVRRIFTTGTTPHWPCINSEAANRQLLRAKTQPMIFRRWRGINGTKRSNNNYALRRYRMVPQKDLGTRRAFGGLMADECTRPQWLACVWKFIIATSLCTSRNNLPTSGNLHAGDEKRGMVYTERKQNTQCLVLFAE